MSLHSLQPLSSADVEAILKISATSADPQRSSSLAERRTAFMQELSALIDADVWIWVVGQVTSRCAGDWIAVNLLDGGWNCEKERAAMVGLLTHPSLQSAVVDVLNEAFSKDICVTRSRDQILDDHAWISSPAGTAFRAAGFDHFMCSICPIMSDLYSAVRFYRRLSRPAFSERERALVDISFQQTCWLHPQNGASAAAKDALMNLSPRERQVLLLLLKGDSRKQVARKLTLSEHTVADYLKVIYRKLDVCSRAELLTKYLHNGQEHAVPPPAFSKAPTADRSAG